MIGDAVADEALSWVNTPADGRMWGQSVKGVGCDCKGLVRGVAKELGRPEADSFYGAFASYRADRPVPADLLLEGFEALFDRVEEKTRGDILLMKYGNPPTQLGHMGIYVGGERAVHAHVSPNGLVRERDLRVLFHKFPLHSIWRWRDE